mgnify:CR=1 FL=1
MYGIRFKMGSEAFILADRLYFDAGMACVDADSAPITFPYRVVCGMDTATIHIHDKEVFHVRMVRDGVYASPDFQGEVDSRGLCGNANDCLSRHFAVVPVGDDVFSVSCGDFTLRIADDHTGYYIVPQARAFQLCQDYLDLDRHDLVSRFGLEECGTWPYGTRKRQLAVLEALNGNSRAVRPRHAEYRDSCLSAGNDRFFVRQTRFGRYYLCGNIDRLFDLLQVRNRAGLVKLLRPLLGDRKVTGVFPETETREKLESIIKFIIRCMD